MSASFPVPDAALRFLMDIRTPITPAQMTRTAAGTFTGRTLEKAFSEKITRYRISANASTTDFFHRRMTACRIRTQTHTRIPANACCTTGRSAKFDRKEAITRMIIIGPVKKPAVAQSAPATLSDKSGDVKRDDAGRTLPYGKIVPQVIHCRPVPFVDEFPLEKRKHRIPSAEIDTADLDKSNV